MKHSRLLRLVEARGAVDTGKLQSRVNNAISALRSLSKEMNTPANFYRYLGDVLGSMELLVGEVKDEADRDLKNHLMDASLFAGKRARELESTAQDQNSWESRK